MKKFLFVLLAFSISVCFATSTVGKSHSPPDISKITYVKNFESINTPAPVQVETAFQYVALEPANSDSVTILVHVPTFTATIPKVSYEHQRYSSNSWQKDKSYRKNIKHLIPYSKRFSCNNTFYNFI